MPDESLGDQQFEGFANRNTTHGEPLRKLRLAKVNPRAESAARDQLANPFGDPPGNVLNSPFLFSGWQCAYSRARAAPGIMQVFFRAIELLVLCGVDQGPWAASACGAPAV